MTSTRSTATPADENHATRWAEILNNTPTLATFTSKITHKGFAKKRGPTSRNIFNWTKRFFLLQEPFLSYFATNDQKTPCRGTIYLVGATVMKMPLYPGQPNVLKIEPVCRRNLRSMKVIDDENNYYLSFETEKELDRWHDFLSEAASAKCDGTGGDNEKDDHTSLGKGDGSDGTSKADDSAYKATLVDEDDEDDEGALSGSEGGLDDTFYNAGRLANHPNEEPSIVFSPKHVKKVPPPPATSNSSLSCDSKRKSFFNPKDTVRCKNTDFVHQNHCTVCKASPIHGFMYTCVVCDNVRLCAQCFREEDHSSKHLFIVEPDLDGESLRMTSSLEGSYKLFRIVELVAFEAIFRTIAGTLHNTSTKPIPKRKLIAFWHSAINGGVGIEMIDEKLLLQLCRQPATVDFDEFMLLIRIRVMKGREEYRAVLEAFDTLTKMMDIALGGPQEDDFVAMEPSSPIFGDHNHPHDLLHDGGSNPKSLKKKPIDPNNLLDESVEDDDLTEDFTAAGGDDVLRRLEMSALNVYLGACTADGKKISFNAFLSLIQRVASVVTGNEDLTEDDLADMVPISGQSETLEETIRLVKFLLTSNAKAVDNLPPTNHRVIEGIEMALLYDRQEGLGMYSSQTESFHPSFCDHCGVHPIIGYRYKCCLRDDYDLCQRCFHDGAVSAGSQYSKLPGGFVVEAPKPPPTKKASMRKRVQFDD